MKRCPSCGTTYTDESLRFCLADGAVLSPSAEQETVLHMPAGDPGRTHRESPIRVDIPTENRPAAMPPPAAPETGTSWLKIFLVVGLFGALVVIGVVGAGALIYFNKDKRVAETNSNATPARATPTPAANTETDKLREQIANLEKRLNEQKNSNRPIANTSSNSDQPTVTQSAARVNSPSDGFLALRSFPNSEAGERLTQIPHGTILTINGCLPRTKIGSKTGRWCRTQYNSLTGWVFDAWLIY